MKALYLKEVFYPRLSGFRFNECHLAMARSRLAAARTLPPVN